MPGGVTLVPCPPHTHTPKQPSFGAKISTRVSGPSFTVGPTYWREDLAERGEGFLSCETGHPEDRLALRTLG